MPASPWEDVDDGVELREIADIVAHEIAARRRGDDGSPVGFALARRAGSRLGRLTDLYVAPAARRGGVATALVREAVSRLRELGLEFVRLEVMASNADARVVYGRWGFARGRADAGRAARRARPATRGRWRRRLLGGRLRPDRRLAAVERAVSAFAPRIRSQESHVDEPRERLDRRARRGRSAQPGRAAAARQGAVRPARIGGALCSGSSRAPSCA